MILSQRLRLAAIAAATAFTALFLWSWWNRFTAGTGVDSVFLFAGRELLAGRIPYRDFGLVVPPLEIFKAAALTAAFPEQAIPAARLFGLLERCLCAAVLMLWLTRLFPLRAAFLAAATSMVLFSAASADPMAGYNQSASTWAVFAGYFASRSLDAPRWYNLLLAGAACAGGLLTKQTTGLGLCAAVGCVLLIALARRHGPRLALQAIATLLLGWLLVFGAVLLWLQSHQALDAFVQQVFLQGASAKGPLWMSLLRPLRMAVTDPWLRQELAAAGLLVAGLFLWLRRTRTAAPPPDSLPSAAAALCLLALGATYTLTRFLPHLATFPRIDTLERLAVFATLAGSAGFAGSGLFSGPRFAQLWLFGAVSLAVAYMHLSFVITHGVFIPGLAFLLAYAFARLDAWPRHALTALCLLALTLSAFHKWMLPFSWYGWTDAPVYAAEPLRDGPPGLAAIRGGAEQQEFTRRLTAYLRDHSGPRREAYLFFYLPQFYLLSGTRPATYSFTPFIDVASDEVARRDAQTLLDHPPPVIGYTVVDGAELTQWETDFRAGRPSGQRDLVAALDRLVADYQLLDTLAMPGSGRPLRVYVQKNPLSDDGLQ